MNRYASHPHQAPPASRAAGVRPWLGALLALGISVPGWAAEPPESAALAVADAALEAISAEDFIALTDLMLEDTTIYAAGERDGQRTVRRRGYVEERTQTAPGDILERGWDPEVRVSGSVAMVWYPYDLWLDGEWVHCGVDIFNLVQTDAGWRIASIVYSADQPPVCAMHPDGPPEG
jgi:hypothetical protein